MRSSLRSKGMVHKKSGQVWSFTKSGGGSVGGGEGPARAVKKIILIIDHQDYGHDYRVVLTWSQLNTVV